MLSHAYEKPSDKGFFAVVSHPHSRATCSLPLADVTPMQSLTDIMYLQQELCQSILNETRQQLSQASPAHAQRWTEALLQLASHPDRDLQASLWHNLSVSVSTLEPAQLQSIAQAAQALIVQMDQVWPLACCGTSRVPSRPLVSIFIIAGHTLCGQASSEF